MPGIVDLKRDRSKAVVMEKGRTSIEDLDSALAVRKRLMLPGGDWSATANEATAKNVLHQELGYFDDKLPGYQLDQETRDILIVHARQDAAHALLNTMSLMSDVHHFKKSLRSLTFTIWLLVLAFIAWRNWPLITEWIGTLTAR